MTPDELHKMGYAPYPINGSRGVIVTSGGAVVNGGMMLTNYQVQAGETASAFYQGKISACTTSAGGQIHISSGAVASECTAMFNGGLYISSGGIASNCMAEANGNPTFIVYSGGRATSCTIVQSGGREGRMLINAGASATGVQLSGVKGAGFTYTTLTVSGSAEQINMSGDSLIGNYGIIKNVTTQNKEPEATNALIYLQSNSIAQNVNLNYGYIRFFGGNAVLKSSYIESPGSIHSILDGCIVEDSVVNANITFCSSGGLIRRTSMGGISGYVPLFNILAGGRVETSYITSGGIMGLAGEASGLFVSSGGTLKVSSGGSALNVTSQTGATVTVLDGGYISYYNPIPTPAAAMEVLQTTNATGEFAYLNGYWKLMDNTASGNNRVWQFQGANWPEELYFRYVTGGWKVCTSLTETTPNPSWCILMDMTGTGSDPTTVEFWQDFQQGNIRPLTVTDIFGG